MVDRGHAGHRHRLRQTLSTKSAILAVAAAVLTACGSSASAAGNGQAASQPDPPQVHLGYLTTLTHAPALIGVEQGFFSSFLPSGTALSTTTFSAGPAESEALLGGSLDAAFVGPSPAIKAFTSTKGGVVIVAGATAGGAGLVVSPAIAAGRFPADLEGTTLATPQLGNTQDVALRSWLAQHGLTSNVNGGGADVTIDSSSGNSLSVQNFKAHQVAGGWLPEPYESQLVLAGGKLVVDEASLWPGGQFPTTELVVTRALLTEHPDIVTDLLEGLIKTEQWIGANPAQAPGVANTALAQVTGSKALDPGVLAVAWSHLTFTLDPLGAALQADAGHAQQLGLLATSALAGIIDIGPLNELRAAAGQAALSAGGLGS